MHVYFREEPVQLEMREVDPEGLVEEGTDLIPVAFYVSGNAAPSFRALLPAETVAVLEEAMLEPVQLGLLAEEPEEPGGEVRAMVGVTITMEGLPDGEADEEVEEEEEAGTEPWATNPDAWKSAAEGEADGDRTVMLAFAPLVRLARRFPDDFSEELADLLETALSGQTKPNLQARIDRMLGDL